MVMTDGSLRGVYWPTISMKRPARGRRRAAPVGDAQPPAAVDDLGPPSLVQRHRVDDRLDRLELIVLDLRLLQLLRHARQHPDDARQRAHLLELLHLLEEVVERELAFH